MRKFNQLKGSPIIRDNHALLRRRTLWSSRGRTGEVSRRPTPRGSSTAAPGRRRSMPRNHRIRSHGCAWDTCRSRLRCSAGLIKNVRTYRRGRGDACRRASAVRRACGNLQTHGPGRCLRLPDPSVPKPSRSSSISNPPLHPRERVRPCTVKRISVRTATIGME